MGRSADNPLKDAFASLGRVTVLFLDTMRSIFAKRFRVHDLVEQLHFIGVKSQSVVLLTGAFTGMVMCAQFYIQFHKVKMDSAVMSVVSVAMARELGAVLTSLMIAGRVGAAMAAQLGTMKVTEQIDAPAPLPPARWITSWPQGCWPCSFRCHCSPPRPSPSAWFPGWWWRYTCSVLIPFSC